VAAEHRSFGAAFQAGHKIAADVAPDRHGWL
jgi:hypothetical protein